MGSSYRDDLNRGSLPEWEGKLRQALGLIESVQASISECLCGDDQFDNAADDGALRERLGIVAQLISSELPKLPEVNV